MGDVKDSLGAPPAPSGLFVSQMLSLDDVQTRARDVLPKALYEYVASGSDDEQTLWENRQGFKRLLLRPRVMRNVGRIDMSTEVMGVRVSMPVLISPAGVHALMSPEGECATARAAVRAGVLMGVSQHSTRSMEDVAAASGDPSRLWYQLYILRDRDLTASLVRRAEAVGYSALVLTVDSCRFGTREADWRNGFAGLPPHLSLANYPTRKGYDEEGRVLKGWDQISEGLLDPTATWDRDLPWLRSLTRLPIIAKGVLSPDDALAAARAGCTGIIVSNHGGRQLDSCLSSIEALEPIVEALRAAGYVLASERPASADRRSGDNAGGAHKGVVTVMLDSGVRRGTDVLKALALGASACLLGKPLFFGLAVGGQEGVGRVLDIMRAEVEAAMALCGCAAVGDITRDLVIARPGASAYIRPSRL